MTTDSAEPARPTTDRPPVQPADAGPSSPAPAEPGPALSRWPARVLLLGIAVVMWAVDQVVKAQVVAHLTPEKPVHVIGSLVQFTLVRNSGAAFSLGVNYTMVFTVIAIVAALFVLIVLLPRTRHRGWAVALGLLLAGILGNLTDRLVRAPGPLRGHVVDFIQLPHFAIFNVADMCVTTAAVMIIVLAVFVNVSLGGTHAKDKQPAEDRQAAEDRQSDAR